MKNLFSEGHSYAICWRSRWCCLLPPFHCVNHSIWTKLHTIQALRYALPSEIEAYIKSNITGDAAFYVRFNSSQPSTVVPTVRPYKPSTSTQCAHTHCTRHEFGCVCVPNLNVPFLLTCASAAAAAATDFIIIVDGVQRMWFFWREWFI